MLKGARLKVVWCAQVTHTNLVLHGDLGSQGVISVPLLAEAQAQLLHLVLGLQVSWGLSCVYVAGAGCVELLEGPPQAQMEDFYSRTGERQLKALPHQKSTKPLKSVDGVLKNSRGQRKRNKKQNTIKTQTNHNSLSGKQTSGHIYANINRRNHGWVLQTVKSYLNVCLQKLSP